VTERRGGHEGRPTQGVRYVLERVDGDGQGTDVVYRGFAHLPGADLPLEARVAATTGAVRATIERGGAPEAEIAEMEKAAAALVRSATKALVAAGRPLPRKIARWRG
jgi:hypothetical protein